jgi:hypothetical protein
MPDTLPEKQINLSSEEKINFTANGPVFEFGPGWGAKTKTWLRKYFLKAVLPAIVFLSVLILLTRSLDKLSGEAQLTITPGLNKPTIVLTVVRGDSWPSLARKAITEYLERDSNKKFSPGQKLFAEEKLRVLLATAKNLKVNQQITVSSGDIQSALDQALLLNKFELAIWNNYAEKAGIR